MYEKAAIVQFSFGGAIDLKTMIGAYLFKAPGFVELTLLSLALFFPHYVEFVASDHLSLRGLPNKLCLSWLKQISHGQIAFLWEGWKIVVLLKVIQNN